MQNIAEPMPVLATEIARELFGEGIAYRIGMAETFSFDDLYRLVGNLHRRNKERVFHASRPFEIRPRRVDLGAGASAVMDCDGKNFIVEVTIDETEEGRQQLPFLLAGSGMNFGENNLGQTALQIDPAAIGLVAPFG
jgi:hypothetical protein